MSDDSQDRTRTRRGDAGSTSENDDSTPLKRLGDFELLREIGRGGMGVVYVARQISLNRRVALKVLPPGLGLTGQAVRRFEREAQAAAKLHHTGIVPVHATGSEDGCHYYAMELIEGQALSEVLCELSGAGSNPLMDATVTKLDGEGEGGDSSSDEREVSHGGSSITSLSDTDSGSRRWFDVVAKLISEVADALHYAHGRGVIHRDIKPANLMLSSEGRLCITDFGLARVTQEPGMTVSGSLMGTPAYMSPEQVASGRMKLDHRTDVYSLGTVLYELLTHERPFPGDSREEVLGGILTKDPRPPRRFNPRVPVDLETICLKAMEKDPDRRYGSAQAMAEDLKKYLRHDLIAARRAGPIRKTGKWIRRHRAGTIAVLGAFILVIVGGIAWIGWRGKTEQATQRTLADARLDWRAGRYEDGLDKTARVLAVDAESTAARRLRALILIEMARNQESVDEAMVLLESDPDDWVGNLILADLSGLDLSGISREEHLHRVETAAPESAEVYYVRSTVAESDTERSTLLSRALELDPSYSEALVARIQSHNGLKQFEPALIDCERLIAVRPESTQGRRMRAWVHATQRDYIRSQVDIDRAIDLDPAEYRNYWAAALFDVDTGHIREAIEALDRELKTAPDYWLAGTYWRKAEAEFVAGRFEEAVGAARMAIDGRRWPAYATLLKSYACQDEEASLRETLDDLQRVAESWDDPLRRSWAHRVQSQYRRMLGDHERALGEAERAVELAPERFQGYVRRAEAKRSLGDEAGFQEDCGLAARTDSWKALDGAIADDLIRRGAWLLGYCDQHEQALEDFTLAAELAPRWADPYRTRAHVHIQGDRLDHALSDLDRAIELQPGSPRAYYDRGRVHLILEHLDEALSDLSSALRLGGDGDNLRWQLALVLVRLGRVDEAVATLDEAIERMPDSELGYRRRASVLFWLGRVDESLKSLNAAIDIRPNSGWPYLLRAGWTLVVTDDCGPAAADLARARARTFPWGEKSTWSSSNPTARTASKDSTSGLETEFVDPAGASSLDGGVAWLHAAYFVESCPNQYDRELALESARNAVRLNPRAFAAWSTLGLALYRNELYVDARDALSTAAELQSRQDPVSLFTLAMTHWRLGSRGEARRHYDLGVDRVMKTFPDNPEYSRFAREAADLLGVQADRD